MPISVVCPDCQTQLKVPDTAARKRVKCPRCESPITVPDAPPPLEVLDVAEIDDAPPPPPPPRPRQAAPVAPRPQPQVEYDDEDEVESDDAPQTELPRNLLEQVFTELTKGERLIWACQPSPRVMQLRGVGTLIGGCFFAGIGVLVAGVVARASGISLIPILIGILFPSFGLLIGILGIAFAKKQAKNTIYALTNRRAIVWRTQYFGTAQVEHYDAAAVRGLKRENSFIIKGAGDVIFRQDKTIVVTTSRRGASTSTKITNYGFLHVEAAQEVEKLVRETLHIRFREDDVLPEPNPAAVVRAQAKVAGKPLGMIGVVGVLAAIALLVVPAGIGAILIMSAPVGKQGAFGLPGNVSLPELKKAEPGSPEDWANIFAALNGEDGFKISAAADRLSKMQPDDHRKEVVAALAKRLTTDSHGRDECARALAVWAGTEDAPVLVDALKNQSGAVKTAALAGLGRLKVPETAEPIAGLLITGTERDKARNALIAIGPPAEPAVLPLLDEANKDTKIDALRVLAKIGTSASLPAIEKIAALKSKDRGLAKEAEDAAKEIRKRK
ncbi:hypothetical protein [Fimbriiglobus ruber]|uniref:Uncharacterized protein n=1 Tax=Fimbriiglobus ruber TaxID=1908690 RepID=A0A225DX55_9BACT|nr:hypothetical protein [Fimbriiglobus ruber]OWK41779.1 hypothetical protein FRUB_03857 [Fimbriiglobus ruber]